jgi:hypothetical protein
LEVEMAWGGLEKSVVMQRTARICGSSLLELACKTRIQQIRPEKDKKVRKTPIQRD